MVVVKEYIGRGTRDSCRRTNSTLVVVKECRGTNSTLVVVKEYIAEEPGIVAGGLIVPWWLSRNI